jgi:hypothetical protein
MTPTLSDIEQVRGRMELQAMAACWLDAPPHIWQQAAVDYFALARSLELQPFFMRQIERMPAGRYEGEAILDVARTPEGRDYLNAILARRKGLSAEFRADIRRALTEAKSSPPVQSATFSTAFPGGAKATLRVHAEGYSIAWTNPPKTRLKATAIHPLVVKWLKDCAVEYGLDTDLAIHSFWLTAPAVPASDPTTPTANI